MKFAFHASEVLPYGKVKFEAMPQVKLILPWQNQLFGQRPHSFAKPLIMHDFALAEEFYDVVYIGIVAKPENIVVGDSRLLLC